MKIQITLTDLQAETTLNVLLEARRWMDTDHTQRIVESICAQLHRRFRIVVLDGRSLIGPCLTLTKAQAEVLRDILSNTGVDEDQPIVDLLTAALTTRRQTASNNPMLQRAFQTYNRPIYRRLLALMNQYGPEACFDYLRPMYREEAHARLARQWGQELRP